MIRRAGRFALTLALSLSATACGVVGSASSYSWLGAGSRVADGREEGTGAMAVRWRVPLIQPDQSRYVPVELASAGFDAHRGRIYLGASDGRFRAFDAAGRVLYAYRAGAPIESAPAVDLERDEVFVAGTDGRVHALQAGTGEVAWVGDTGGVIRAEPVLTEDAVYVSTGDDTVVALSRQDGESLWTYRREGTGEFHIAGHAGIAIENDRVFAAFSDGLVAALGLADGAVYWERATDVDIEVRDGGAPVFTDVDTTPVVLDDQIYIASFHGGLYALDITNGSVLWRDAERTTITAIVATDGRLLLASAERGLELIYPDTRETVWERPVDRGAPTRPVVSDQGLVLVGESQGSLLALALQSGQELGRLDGGNGFSAPAAVSYDLGMILTNGGEALCVRFR